MTYTQCSISSATLPPQAGCATGLRYVPKTGKGCEGKAKKGIVKSRCKDSHHAVAKFTIKLSREKTGEIPAKIQLKNIAAVIACLQIFFRMQERVLETYVNLFTDFGFKKIFGIESNAGIFIAFIFGQRPHI